PAMLLSMITLAACAASPQSGDAAGGAVAAAAAPVAPAAASAPQVSPAASAAAPAAATSPTPAAATSAAATPATPGAAATQPAPRTPSTPPYFQGDTTDFFLIMPPAPTDGDARDQADRRIFRDTRALQGSPRWHMAADDAELGTAAMLRHFSCSLGVDATPEQLPRTVAVLQKAMREAARSVGRAKDHYQRKRPFLVDQGATCVTQETIGESYDY